MRLPNLSERPIHHDEAEHAHRFGMLLEDGTYVYDAANRHGSTLYYLTLPVAWLSGQKDFASINETTVRIVPLVFGLLLIITTPLLRNGMGITAVVLAGLLTTLSPTLVYYSRFYIQEILLVFFTCLALGAGWQSWHFGTRSWAFICGLALGLMFATKETSVLAFVAMAGAALLCGAVAGKLYLPIKNILIGAVAAVLVSALLFSAFGTHAMGPVDSILAFKGYFTRGIGVATDHVHPWNHYLHLLAYYRLDQGPIWSESLVLVLGIVGCTVIVRNQLPVGCNVGLARFLMFYTLLLTGLYSAIPYKPPWCCLSFLYGWILLAGYGGAVLLRIRRWRWIALVLMLGASFQLAIQAKRATDRYAADPRNPYAYAHTSPDLKRLIKRVRQIEAISPQGRGMYIQVIADSQQTLPLSFYLRSFTRVSYWADPTNAPKNPLPDLLISSPELDVYNPVDYLTEYYALRPETLIALHIRSELWERFIETQH